VTVAGQRQRDLFEQHGEGPQAKTGPADGEGVGHGLVADGVTVEHEFAADCTRPGARARSAGADHVDVVGPLGEADCGDPAGCGEALADRQRHEARVLAAMRDFYETRGRRTGSR